jgi:DNA-binding transcriptional LysR family regulator
MLRAMKIFVGIVEQGSLTAAAQAVEMSPTSVVRTLAALERRLGIVLVQRTTRRIRITEDGFRYLGHCRTILDMMARSGQDMASTSDEPAGKLTVTASTLFGRVHIVPIVLAVLARHAGLSIDLMLMDRVVNLVEEGVDIAVRIGALTDSNLTAVRVGQVRHVVCASPGYLKKHSRPQAPEDIRSHASIRHLGLDPRPEWSFRAGNRQRAIAISPVLTTNQIDAALDACEHGLGLGRFLSYQVARARARGHLVYVLEEFEIPPLPIHVLFLPTKPQSARVRAFVDACVIGLRQSRYD